MWRHPSWVTALGSLAVLVLPLLGCKFLGLGGDDEGQPSASASGSAGPPPLEPAKRDPRVLEAVEEIRLYCAFKNGRYGHCRPDARAQARRLAGRDLRNDPVVLDTLSGMLLEEKHERLLAGAVLMLDEIGNVHVLPGLMPKHNPKHLSFVSDSTARRLLQALATKPEALRAVREVVWVATGTGRLDEVVATLEKLPGDPKRAAEARLDGYRELMTFGRLKGFEHLKKFAGSGKPQEVRVAVGAAYGLPDPTVAERQAICPWLKGYLANTDDDIAAAAARTGSLLCDDSFVTAVLDVAEKRLKEKRVSQDYMQGLHSLCRDEPKSEEARAYWRKTPESECQRLYAFARGVADSEDFKVFVREIGFGLASGAGDQETLTFCQKHTPTDYKKDFHIRDAAKRCVKRVRETMKEAGQ